MKANELRIGNLVLKYGSEILITPYDLINIELSLNEYEPIPLTEEWLLKFGFVEELDKKPSLKHGNYFSIWVMDYKYSFSYADFRKDWGFYHSYTDAGNENDNNRFDFISCGIKHVHQLQNLYFALTGEELQVKE